MGTTLVAIKPQLVTRLQTSVHPASAEAQSGFGSV